jgi:hypothetical protein
MTKYNKFQLKNFLFKNFFPLVGIGIIIFLTCLIAVASSKQNNAINSRAAAPDCSQYQRACQAETDPVKAIVNELNKIKAKVTYCQGLNSRSQEYTDNKCQYYISRYKDLNTELSSRINVTNEGIVAVINAANQWLVSTVNSAAGNDPCAQYNQCLGWSGGGSGGSGGGGGGSGAFGGSGGGSGGSFGSTCTANLEFYTEQDCKQSICYTQGGYGTTVSCSSETNGCYKCLVGTSNQTPTPSTTSSGQQPTKVPVVNGVPQCNPSILQDYIFQDGLCYYCERAQGGARQVSVTNCAPPTVTPIKTQTLTPTKVPVVNGVPQCNPSILQDYIFQDGLCYYCERARGGARQVSVTNCAPPTVTPIKTPTVTAIPKVVYQCDGAASKGYHAVASVCFYCNGSYGPGDITEVANINQCTGNTAPPVAPTQVVPSNAVPPGFNCNRVAGVSNPTQAQKDKLCGTGSHCNVANGTCTYDRFDCRRLDAQHPTQNSNCATGSICNKCTGWCDVSSAIPPSCGGTQGTAGSGPQVTPPSGGYNSGFDCRRLDAAHTNPNLNCAAGTNCNKQTGQCTTVIPNCSSLRSEDGTKQGVCANTCPAGYTQDDFRGSCYLSQTAAHCCIPPNSTPTPSPVPTRPKDPSCTGYDTRSCGNGGTQRCQKVWYVNHCELSNCGVCYE